jgi:transcriptional regulator with XRE-family HTH domain
MSNRQGTERNDAAGRATDEEGHTQYLQRLHSLGPLLEERRIAMGISQREMSRRTGIAQSTLSRLESGSFDTDIGLRYLPAMASGYGLPALELLEHVFPGLVQERGGLEGDPELTTELRPTKAYERSILGLKEQISALRREVQGIRDAQHELGEQLVEAISEMRSLARELRPQPGGVAVEQALPEGSPPCLPTSAEKKRPLRRLQTMK